MNQVRLHTAYFPYIRDVGQTLTGDGWIHPDRIRDFNVFIFVIQGRMQVVEEGVEYRLQEGTGFFLKSGLHHWGGSGTLPDTMTIWIHFYDRLPGSTDDRAPEEGGLQPFHTARTYRVFSPADYQSELVLPKLVQFGRPALFIAKLKELYELYSSAPMFSHVLMSMKAMDLFLDVYRQSLDGSRQASKSDAVVARLAVYLEQHWEQKLNPAEIGTEFQLNYRYMSTLFKNKMGISIFHYHERIRVHKAAEMLKSTTMNISEVSDCLNFTNAYYFSRVFKRVMGESPSEYIRNIYRS